MTTYLNPFSGATIEPAQVGYEALTITVNTTLEWPINGNDTIPAAGILDVTATVANLQIILPPATQVSVGQQIVIRNTGSITFTVTTNAANTQVVSVISGVAQFIFLTNNSTIDGVWSAVTLGAGTSVANAGQLAGFGVIAEGVTLNQNYPLSSVFSNYSILSTGQASFYVWTGGAGTLTMPAANTLVPGWFCMIRNNGTGILTIAPATSSGDVIDTTSLQIGESLVLVSNLTSGSVGFSSFGYGRSNTFAYTLQIVNITATPYTLSTAVAASTVQKYTTALTSAAVVIVPSTVQIYAITNATGYSLNFQTVTGTYAAATIANGNTNILVSDGYNVYNATTGSGSLTTIQLAAGAAATPSLAFISGTGTGLYLAAGSNLGISSNGANVATFQTGTPGIIVPGGISGGTF